jgi:hypothetical protein
MPKQVTEKTIHQQVCHWLKLQYSNLIFTSDASGMRVSIGLRVELKRKRCDNYKIPDLLIFHPTSRYRGLFIEIKTDKSDVYNKNGVMKPTEHIQEQAKTLERLNELGYKAEFGFGFNHCLFIITSYMKNAV